MNATGSPCRRRRLFAVAALGLIGCLTGGLAPTGAGALTSAPAPATTDLAFTVDSVSAVYHPGDGSSVVFVRLRNDTSTTLSLATGFAVTFYDVAGDPLGTATAGTAGAGLSSALRCVPPGQVADVSARLPGLTAARAVVTRAAAAGSPYSDPRLPLSGAPTVTAAPAADGGGELVSASVVNTSGYPDRLRVAVLAEGAAGQLLGVVTSVPGQTLPSGSSATVSTQYQRLPGEPVADHYDVLAEGLPDGAAASTFTPPSTTDTPTSGTRATVLSQLLDGRGRALSGALVDLTARRNGRTTVLTRARTDSRGRVSLSAVLPSAGQLQLTFAGDPVHAPVGTGDFAFRLHPRLSGVPSASRGLVAVRGALPDYAGERVSLQELIGNRWRTVRAAVAARTGAVRFAVRAGRGRHTYRLSVDATTAHLAATTGHLVAVV